MNALIQRIQKNSNLIFIDPNLGTEHSFSELLSFYEELNQLSGVNKGLIFLYPDNSVKSIQIFFNCFASNNAIALLSPNLNEELKNQLEKLYNPFIIIDQTRNEVVGYENFKISNGINIHKIKNRKHYSVHPELKLLLSTSGTTGSPKFVKLALDNIYSNCDSILNYLPINNKDVTPLNLPIYYSYGLSVLTTNSCSGGKIICTNNDVLSHEFWKEFNEYGFTTLSGVPFVYEMLNRTGFIKKDFPTLRYLTQAGGKLNNKLVELFGEYAQSKNIDFYIMYGQTEATARMSYLEPPQILSRLGSIGKAIKGGKFIIDQSGELFYKGPNVGAGYATSPEDLSVFIYQDLLQTGDIAEVDKDGFYYIVGRMKRFVKLFGNRINLDEVENSLKVTFTSHSFACIGEEDKTLRVFMTEGSGTVDDVLQYLKGKFSIHHSSIKIKVVESLQLTANGKVDYNSLKSTNGSK
jgi:long-chain acyl-CoA synthetase